MCFSLLQKRVQQCHENQTSEGNVSGTIDTTTVSVAHKVVNNGEKGEENHLNVGSSVTDVVTDITVTHSKLVNHTKLQDISFNSTSKPVRPPVTRHRKIIYNNSSTESGNFGINSHDLRTSSTPQTSSSFVTSPVVSEHRILTIEIGSDDDSQSHDKHLNSIQTQSSFVTSSSELPVTDGHCDGTFDTLNIGNASNCDEVNLHEVRHEQDDCTTASVEPHSDILKPCDKLKKRALNKETTSRRRKRNFQASFPMQTRKIKELSRKQHFPHKVMEVPESMPNDPAELKALIMSSLQLTPVKENGAEEIPIENSSSVEKPGNAKSTKRSRNAITPRANFKDSSNGRSLRKSRGRKSTPNNGINKDKQQLIIWKELVVKLTRVDYADVNPPENESTSRAEFTKEPNQSNGDAGESLNATCDHHGTQLHEEIEFLRGIFHKYDHARSSSEGYTQTALSAIKIECLNDTKIIKGVQVDINNFKIPIKFKIEKYRSVWCENRNDDDVAIEVRADDNLWSESDVVDLIARPRNVKRFQKSRGDATESSSHNLHKFPVNEMSPSNERIRSNKMFSPHNGSGVIRSTSATKSTKTPLKKLRLVCDNAQPKPRRDNTSFPEIEVDNARINGMSHSTRDVDLFPEESPDFNSTRDGKV